MTHNLLTFRSCAFSVANPAPDSERKREEFARGTRGRMKPFTHRKKISFWACGVWGSFDILSIPFSKEGEWFNGRISWRLPENPLICETVEVNGERLARERDIRVSAEHRDRRPH